MPKPNNFGNRPAGPPGPSLERSLAGEVGKPAKAAAVRCGSKGRPAGPAPAAKTGREGAIANVARRIFRI